MSIFKPCDIRGVYPSELNESIFRDIGRAIGSQVHQSCGDRPTCVLAGDVRPSTPPLKEALAEGLDAAGVDVTDIGITPTPVAYWAREELGAHAVAIVTASHNPAEYNGLKFMIGDLPVTPEDVATVERRVQEQNFASGSGSLNCRDMRKEYLDWIEDRFAGTGRGLKVLVDAGHGAASQWAPEAFRRADYDVVELYCEPDGTFPDRSPNPSNPKAVQQAGAHLRDSGADFGACYDGDGDRVVFLDEHGSFVPAEEALVLLARRQLEEEPGAAVVYDQKCPSLVSRQIEAAGGAPVPERSGHAFIKRRMIQEDAVMAGEVSGHMFFRAIRGDDGIYAALALGEALARSGRSLGDLLAELPPYYVSPDVRIPCPVGEAERVVAHVAEEFSDLPQDEMDGVRIEFPDGWALCRPSVTEPVITLRVEGDTPEKLESIRARMQAAIEASLEG
jgi:phosphomannomutase/phosphoglucomutase